MLRSILLSFLFSLSFNYVSGNTQTSSQTCDFSIVKDPFTEVLSFCVNEPIEPFIFEISTNCTTTGVNIAVQGLPSGIDYTQNSTDQGISLSFQGVPTTADVAFVNITVSTDNFQSSTGGMITIDGKCIDSVKQSNYIIMVISRTINQNIPKTISPFINNSKRIT